MGQHRIQRQILSNFSFEGRQMNSRVTWHLRKNSYRPEPRSIYGVGFFEVACSDSVDQYITDLENGFKETLDRFSHGKFAKADVGRETYDFIAMHYVRSQACRIQIEHMVRECWRASLLTQPQAEEEYRRLTSHQDLEIFGDLVDSVSPILTHYVLRPLLMTGPWSFMTSDKIIYAGQVESKQREIFVWFPLAPSIGLSLTSESPMGQILGPIEVNRSVGRISFIKIPEASLLRCQEPSHQEVREEVITAFNELMIHASSELYAGSCLAIDSTLRASNGSRGYRYKPTSANQGPIES